MIRRAASVGDTRVVKRFALFPQRIWVKDGKRYWIWMQSYWKCQYYTRRMKHKGVLLVYRIRLVSTGAIDGTR